VAEPIDLLEGMNEAQRQAVTAPDGPVLVLAGPGSGKTRVLTRRIAHLIQNNGVPPWRIIAVTFTNKAAREMKHRIETMLGQDLRGLSMGTFHSTCARILRREAAHLPFSADYVIYDSADQRSLMKEVVSADLALDEKRYSPEKILNRVSSLKNDLIEPNSYRPTSYFDEIVQRAYEAYNKRLIGCNAVDFDDILMYMALLLRNNREVRLKYQNAYDHVLVDEFQDTNAAQYEIVRQLSGLRNNLFCVGDEDQSIYRWRGADYRNVIRLRTDYPDLTTILLEQNYRSTQIILDASRAVIDQNTARTKKNLFTERTGGPELVLYEAYDERDEAQFVVDTIATMVARREVEPGECAVMYRTNAQSRTLEETFVRENLPYKLVGATRFYARKEIKDVLAYLRLVHNPDDTVSLERVINNPPRGIGDKTVSSLQMWAQSENISPGEAVMRLAEFPELGSPVTGRARTALAGFGNLLIGWREAKGKIPLGRLLQLILDETGYAQSLEDGTDQGEERIQNVAELLKLTGEYEEVELSTFLEEVALISEVDNLTEEANAPTLLTLHAAKGLEFDVVFLVGLEEGVLPHSRSLDDPEEMAEERRLMYVGMTRARRNLFLIYTFQRTVWGESSLNLRSRFINDIPANLISSTRGMGGGALPKQQQVLWGSRPPRVTEPARPAGQHFRTGQRVYHARFGEGLVIESRAIGNDEEVSVVFEEAGLKRLMASFANMEIITEK
jgi:DNA helicase II / ATP-dependent DNA helicase PcrA